jgi:nucleoside 2-deoxyribosyltransferase
MGYLSGRTVYLAGPIHAVKDDGTGWRDAITPKLLQFGLNVDDPCKITINGQGEVAEDKKKIKGLIKNGNFLEAKKLFYPIVKKDLRCVDKADFIIVLYDPTIHMLGTIHEIIVARNQRKPVLLWFNEEHIEHVNPWILTFVKHTNIFTSIDEVIQYLRSVDSGNFDSSYWTL